LQKIAGSRLHTSRAFPVAFSEGWRAHSWGYKPEPTGGPIDFGPGGLGRAQRDLPIRAEHTAILNPKWAVVIWRHPFDSEIRFRAIFDPRPLGYPELSEVLTLEFSLPRAKSAVRTQVKVFPSSDSLPENLLRFFVCFSNPMRRGRAEEQITLLFCGRSLGEIYKSFHVTEAIREPIAVEQWTILPPAKKGHQSLVLLFLKPLDWALLWHAISIASEGGQSIDGRIDIDLGERQWSFTPTSKLLNRRSRLGHTNRRIFPALPFSAAACSRTIHRVGDCVDLLHSLQHGSVIQGDYTICADRLCLGNLSFQNACDHPGSEALRRIDG
jgi:hypothetical protein